MRLSVIAQAIVLIGVFSGVYNVANKYEAIEKNVKQLDSDSEREHETTRVLQAEWAFLTNPERMEKIARDYFHLEAFDGRQMVAMNNIPLRASLDANDDNVDIAKTDALPKKQIQTAAADTTPATALPAPLPLPGMVATPVSATRGQQ
jgi:hypothetical protein